MATPKGRATPKGGGFPKGGATPKGRAPREANGRATLAAAQEEVTEGVAASCALPGGAIEGVLAIAQEATATRRAPMGITKGVATATKATIRSGGTHGMAGGSIGTAGIEVGWTARAGIERAGTVSRGAVS